MDPRGKEEISLDEQMEELTQDDLGIQSDEENASDGYIASESSTEEEVNQYTMIQELKTLFDTPGFERYYKDYLSIVHDGLRDQICSWDVNKAKKNNEVVYSYNDLKRNLLAIIHGMMTEPLVAMEEIKAFCDPSNSLMMDQWIKGFIKLINSK